MTTFDDEADREHERDQREARVAAVRRARPERLRTPGVLHPKVAAWVDRLAQGSAENLLLRGEVGTGKTWSAWEALERAAVFWRKRWEFVSPADWQEVIDPPTVQADRDALRRWRDVPLLILDDLGAAQVNEWERKCLHKVVDERWAHARPTVVTYNLQSLETAYGERIGSRLTGGATRVDFAGPDRRRTR
ncbi:ATP-binding protein [Actinomadura opuntiae]|uniref:ATP-binding protein n=1 Tax=Actinomadura sp. OS1-43 TaxID=604315 RepID=UPI00255AB876|nr:ATP-binding protein [Actinomadura sp. OS1-43]MDL4815485.1 ATP-binding protein [Actinomadura sp. OS1-43]